jgi:hypothetical protein
LFSTPHFKEKMNNESSLTTLVNDLEDSKPVEVHSSVTKQSNLKSTNDVQNMTRADGDLHWREKGKDNIRMFLFGSNPIPSSVQLDRLYILFAKCDRKRTRLGRQDWNENEKSLLLNLKSCSLTFSKTNDSVAFMNVVAGMECLLEALYEMIQE